MVLIVLQGRSCEGQRRQGSRKSKELDTLPFSVRMSRGGDGRHGLVSSGREVAQGSTGVYVCMYF